MIASCTAHAATYTVTSTTNAGNGTLRWAIDQANARIGMDTITFGAGLAGSTISPLSELPALEDDATTIDGDLNDDGAPDVTLNGALAPNHTDGLHVHGDRTVLVGLCIVGFATGKGVYLDSADECRIRSCHIGVDRAGTTEQPNQFGLYLLGADSTRIGGASASGRNVIGGNDLDAVVLRGSDNVVVGNYVGVTRDGSAVLRASPTAERRGIADSGERNLIGGTTPEARNVFAGLSYAVRTYTADGCRVQGNYFGLAPDGNTSLETGCGVAICDSTNCTVGGSAPGARNVFAGGANPGVLISIADILGSTVCHDNTVAGNYFGLNAAGSAQRSLKTGVLVEKMPDALAAGAQTIGGGTREAGNWFCPSNPGGESRAIYFKRAGEGSVVRNNVCGVFPRKGSPGTPTQMTTGVRVDGVAVRLLDNSLWRASTGVHLGGAGSEAAIYRNYFNTMQTAVGAYMDSLLRMGDLGTARTSDDGGNEFVNVSAYFIRNNTAYAVKAEGNEFHTTSLAAIDAKIYDQLEWPSYGRVDFDPLIGGVHPTGRTEGVLALTGASAVPTAAGAQLTFTLSAPADVSVSVTNIAGRRVKALCVERECSAGLNTLLWDGRTDLGLAAPAGTYLVQVEARATDGAAARALAPLRLGR
jgi:hypothetical protein